MSATNPVAKFSRISKQCVLLFKLKNAQYGNSIEVGGVLGAAVELLGAPARLSRLVLHAPDHGRANKEKLRDVLMDIHNYATIAIMMLDDDNWEGKEIE
jgi:hypothetical protein